MRRKEAIKNLSLVAEERAPGTRYDRFFFDEFTKKVKETTKIEEIIERLKAVPQEDVVGEIEKLISEYTNQLDKQK